VTGGAPADAPGFDDLLVAAGAGEMAAALLRDIDAAIAAFEGVEGTLADRIRGDLEGARGLHGDVKKVTDHLKSWFVSVLDLNVPQTGAADND
jgi:hypothetical protein